MPGRVQPAIHAWFDPHQDNCTQRNLYRNDCAQQHAIGYLNNHAKAQPDPHTDPYAHINPNTGTSGHVYHPAGTPGYPA